ncbi:MAG TPA: hypothetical protein VH092_24925 [Urbifossiella sp.]|nr:hypothetical protein [Urbifossiella sp.]
MLEEHDLEEFPAVDEEPKRDGRAGRDVVGRQRPAPGRFQQVRVSLVAGEFVDLSEVQLDLRLCTGCEGTDRHCPPLQRRRVTVYRVKPQ